MVKQGSIYRPINRAGFCSSDVYQHNQLGPTVRTVGNFLALLCLVFATALASYLPASLEQRIGSFIFSAA